jgi:general stress protein 26
MPDTRYDKLHDLLADFDTAMLVTRTPEGQLRSRPMAVAAVEPDGALWFMTQRDSAKVTEIEHYHEVNVAFQSKLKFVSISGSGYVVEDRQKVDELWNEAWKHWFPGGKDDPQLMLVCVDGATGEYWDNSGASGIKYLIEAGKAYLSGTRPNVERDPAIHAKVNL